MKKHTNRIAALMLSAVLLTGTVCASNFNASVEQKGAPQIVETMNTENQSVAAIIKDAQNVELQGVPVGDLIVTPLADIKEEEKQVSEAIKKALEAAYEQIVSVKTLDELTEELPAALEAVNKALNTSYQAEDLIVRDLIDVSLSEGYQQYLTDGNSITVIFDLKVNAEEALLVLHNYEGDKWEVIDNDNVKILDNGHVEVTFNSLSPVAFVVTKPLTAVVSETPEEEPVVEAFAEDESAEAEAPVEEEAPAEEAPAEAETSEEKGSNGLLIGGIVVVVAAIGAGAAVLTKKGKKAKAGKK